MDRSVCIHGHFYQPPRHNPWTGLIDPQPSAAPFPDWNARVAAECYTPNSQAKQLDGDGVVRRVVNNYASMSFNFGPTLLSWMEKAVPGTYRAIVDADRLGAEQFNGHGPAVAQAFHHLIMPLATSRDQRTQVVWGIRDFEHRFGRSPEGMWLPETAADTASLEALAEQGILFTILAPSQAKRFRLAGEESWRNAAEGFDVRRPYKAVLPSGRSLALFFYDGPISQEIAFGGLLEKGENLAERLISVLDPDPAEAQLVSIATDGETYGHHKTFGEMALARSLELLQTEASVKLATFASFLADHPPMHSAEIHEQSAWSCAHGVGRWRTNCGCHTGGEAGWTQAWRAPLRNAMIWLRDRLDEVYEEHGSRMLRSPWHARDEFIDVLLDRGKAGAFIDTHALPGSDANTVMQLLEMQNQSMQTQTSCGWFFNDLAGIETVQILRHAGRAVDLCWNTVGLDLEREFLDRLAKARSNQKQFGTGKDIYLNQVGKQIL